MVYDRAETEYRRVQAQGVVPTMIGFVAKDELIVDANQRIDGPALLKLRSLRDIELARRDRSEFLYPPLARMLLMLLFIAAFATYLRMELPWVFGDNGMLEDKSSLDPPGTDSFGPCTFPQAGEVCGFL